MALREGMAKLTEQLAIRTALLRNSIDASQAEAIGVIDELSVKMRQREQKAQETFDRTLSAISRRVLSIAVIFLGIILSAGVLIALSIRLPLQQILAANLARTMRTYLGTRCRDARLERELVLELDKSSRVLDRGLVASDSSPGHKAARREQAVLLANALARLSRSYRDVLIHRHMEGLTFPEIAQTMQRSVDSVKKLWTRALAQLRRAMGEQP